MTPFNLKIVEEGIARTQFAGHLEYFPSVASTNTLALDAAQAGARVGVWVADEQTAGRGRGGHTWHSAAGDGLYVSVLIAPPLPASFALRLSLSTALAAKSAIADVTGVTVDIRWPNDLLVGLKKCGGILVETAVATSQENSAATLRYGVIGIGLNLNHASFPLEIAALATSLRLAGGREVRRETLLAALLQSLDKEIQFLIQDWNGSNGRESLFERFERASTWVRGKRVRVDEAGGYTGVTAGLNTRGFLEVNCDDGQRRTVLSGSVREL